MKKLFAVILLLAIFLSIMPVAMAAPAEELPRVIGCRTLDGDQSLLGNDRITENALSVFLYETKSQTLMYQYNADLSVEPASLVKIMTALIVVDRASMSDAVTVTNEQLNAVPYASTTAGLQAGEVLTVEQLLYCMLVSSANDAAVVLANHIAGSEEAFVNLMNEYAGELGCQNTNFANVHGIYNSEQHSTARDMAKILNAALNHETFRAAFGTEHYTLPANSQSEARELSTNNHLMTTDIMRIYYDTRVVGGRTGITESGLRNLATLAQYEDMELICIVIGSASQIAEDGYSIAAFGGFDETSMLLSKGFKDMHSVQLTQAGQVLTQCPVENGECDVAVTAAESLYAILPESASISDLSYRYHGVEDFHAPIQKDEIISRVEVWYDSVCVAQADLVAMNKVNTFQPVTAGEALDLEEKKHSWLWQAVMIVAAFVLVLLVVRIIRRALRRKAYGRSRQYSRNRKRSR